MKPFPFQKILDWHSENARHNLPWRDYSNTSKKELGYRVWLSEIILQQTQVSRWIEYFNKIFKAFPTVEDLASTDYDTFFEYYSGLGYYSRARNMLKTAIIVSEEFGWIFPEDTANLIYLPWVGPYTAEAIRAFAYEKNTLSFDTNLNKIFSRYYYWNKFQKLTKTENSEIQEQFEKLKISWREINNALMDFATEFNVLEQILADHQQALNSKSAKPLSTVLTPSQEQGGNTILTQKNYPLQDCKYYTTQWELEPLKAKKKSTFPTKQASVFIILHKDHKTYLSDDLDNYTVFKLWVSEINSREFAKQYFLERYNLHISVRPPHKKDFQDWKPYLICYAQIQKWEHDFWEYEWIDKEKISIDL